MEISETNRRIVLIILFLILGVASYFVIQIINQRSLNPDNTSADSRYETGTLAPESKIIFADYGKTFPKIYLENSTIPDGTAAGVDVGCPKTEDTGTWISTVDVTGTMNEGVFTADDGETFYNCISSQTTGVLRFNIESYTETVDLQFFVKNIEDTDILSCTFEDSYVTETGRYTSRVIAPGTKISSADQYLRGDCLSGAALEFPTDDSVSFAAPSGNKNYCILSARVEVAEPVRKTYFCNKFYMTTPDSPVPTPIVAVTTVTQEPTKVPVTTTVTQSPNPTATQSPAPTSTSTPVQTIVPTTTIVKTPTATKVTQPTEKPTVTQSITPSPSVTATSSETPVNTTTPTSVVVNNSPTPTPNLTATERFLNFISQPNVYFAITITVILLIGLVGGLIYYTGSRRS